MTSEEQARAIAIQIRNAVDRPPHGRENDIRYAELLILAALRTREAETWDKAIDVAEKEWKPRTGVPDAYDRGKMKGMSLILEALRARAAQPQVETK